MIENYAGQYFTRYKDGAYKKFGVHSLTNISKDVLFYLMQSHCVESHTLRLVYWNDKDRKPIKQSSVVTATGNNKSAVSKAFSELIKHGILAKDAENYWRFNPDFCEVGAMLTTKELCDLPNFDTKINWQGVDKAFLFAYLNHENTRKVVA